MGDDKTIRPTMAKEPALLPPSEVNDVDRVYGCYMTAVETVVMKVEAGIPSPSISPQETTNASIDGASQAHGKLVQPAEYSEQYTGRHIAPVISITAPSDDQPAGCAPDTARGRPRGRSRATRGASNSRSLSIAGAKSRPSSTKARGKSRSLSVNSRVSKLTLREPKVFKGRGMITWPTCAICHCKIEFDENKGQILSCPFGCEGGME